MTELKGIAMKYYYLAYFPLLQRYKRMQDTRLAVRSNPITVEIARYSNKFYF